MFDKISVDQWIEGIKNFSNYELDFYMWGGEPFCIDPTYDFVKALNALNFVKWMRIDTNLSYAKKILARCPSSKLRLNCSWHTEVFDYPTVKKLVLDLNKRRMVGMLNFVASDVNLAYLQKHGLNLDNLILDFADAGIYMNVAADFNKGNDQKYFDFITKYTTVEDWKNIHGDYPSKGASCDAGSHFFTVEHDGALTSCGRVKDVLFGKKELEIVGRLFAGELSKRSGNCPHADCLSIVSYCHRSDNHFSCKQHLDDYVSRNLAHRKKTGILTSTQLKKIEIGQVCSSVSFLSADTPNQQAIALFIEAQKSFAAGNRVSARRQMAQYQRLVDYSKLPAYHLRDERIAAPRVSVVIVTMNRTSDLLALLENLADQTCRDFEIIVVDNGGTDKDRCHGLCDIYIQNPINFNLSEGRNIGAAFAKGEIIVFLDDDANVGPEYIAAMVLAFERCDILGLRGKTLPKSGHGNRAISVCDLGDTPFPTFCNQEGNSAFLLSAYRAVGGQDPLLFGHEGSDLTWRLITHFKKPNAVIYWPQAVIFHDYGDFSKARWKKIKYKETDDYLLYKYGQYIHGIRGEVEKMQIAPGPSLAAGMPCGQNTYSLCYMDTTAESDKVSSPKVSIIISSYNTAPYLPECLDSIRAQTMQDWECIIVDDGSTDQTQDILRRYAAQDSRFRIYLNSDNIGPYIRRNFAIQQARTPFISLQDADDIMAPQKLQLLLDEIIADDSLGIVGSFFGRFLNTFRSHEFCDHETKRVTHEQIMNVFGMSWHICWHASAVIRKSMFDTVGLYDSQPWGSDTFWLAKAGLYAQLSGKVRFKNLPEILTYKREHSQSQTGSILVLDPRGRRMALNRYGTQKLEQIRSQSQANPSFDYGQSLRNCNCNDFIPKFGHLFQQWESQPLDSKMVKDLLNRAIEGFVARLYVGVSITLNSLCSISPGVEKKIKGLNLIRGMCSYAYGDDQQARNYLHQEYADHQTIRAMQFLKSVVEAQSVPTGGKERRTKLDDYLFAYVAHSTQNTGVILQKQVAPPPAVSVVLDCRTVQADLDSMLAMWNQQTCRDFELVILTDGNTANDFANFAPPPIDLTVINSDDWLSNAAARNIALKHSRGTYIAFISPHLMVQNDCVKMLIDVFRGCKISALRGRIVSSTHSTAHPEWDLGDKMRYCAVDTDLLCAFRREVIENAGGFDEGLLDLEMLGMSWRIYNELPENSNSILYIPQLHAAIAVDHLPDIAKPNYLIHNLAKQQLYWRLTSPAGLQTFFQFVESRYPTNQQMLTNPAVVNACVQFFKDRSASAALEWAQRASSLNPNSLDVKFALAVCEFKAGSKDRGAQLFSEILTQPFIRPIEQNVFGPKERKNYADTINCYAVCCINLAEYQMLKGQKLQGQQILDRLLSNKNVDLDSEKQRMVSRLLAIANEFAPQKPQPTNRFVQAGSLTPPAAEVQKICI